MPRSGNLFLTLVLLLALAACAARSSNESGRVVFEHDFSGAAVPWTPTGFDNGDGKFTFALFSDLTGGSHATGEPMAIDHVSLVTVSANGVDIANLRMSGIFDKTGRVPLNGAGICLETCAER